MFDKCPAAICSCGAGVGCDGLWHAKLWAITCPCELKRIPAQKNSFFSGSHFRLWIFFAIIFHFLVKIFNFCKFFKIVITLLWVKTWILVEWIAIHVLRNFETHFIHKSDTERLPCGPGSCTMLNVQKTNSFGPEFFWVHTGLRLTTLVDRSAVGSKRKLASWGFFNFGLN